MKTIALVLRTGGDFNIKDVELLAYHLHKNKQEEVRIICIYDQVPCPCKITVNGGSVQLIPMPYKWKGWWAKFNLFSPEMEQYRPFLYIDLDTAVFKPDKLFPHPFDQDKFIMIQDFYRKGKFAASGLMWVPKESGLVSKIWDSKLRDKKKINVKSRMDRFIKQAIHTPDLFFQDMVEGIYSFKPRVNGKSKWLRSLPDQTSVICFHGQPRIWEAAKQVEWVNKYVKEFNNQ